MQLLLQQGIKNPNPRKQFIFDFIQQIQNWWSQGKEVLIGIDDNKNVEDPNAKIARHFDETDLINLYHHRHPAKSKLATHQCGSHPIDMMLGSPMLAMALQHAWILPFGEPALIKGDHCLLGLDFPPLSCLAVILLLCHLAYYEESTARMTSKSNTSANKLYDVAISTTWTIGWHYF